MLEAYLFIDPLCKECIQSERNMLRLANSVNSNLSFQFIPMFNFKIIQDSMEKLIGKRFCSINECYRLHYHAILDYKAALFQGKKRGREFFLMLQNELITEGHKYSDDLVLSVAENSKLDLDMFKEDRRSELAKEALDSDQKLVNEMKVKEPSSAVIFNCDTFNSGVLIENVNYSDLCNIFNYGKNKGINNTLCSQNGIPVPNINLL